MGDIKKYLFFMYDSQYSWSEFGNNRPLKEFFMAFFEPKYAEWKYQFQPKLEVMIWKKLEKAKSSTVSSKEGNEVEQESHSHKENLAV